MGSTVRQGKRVAGRAAMDAEGKTAPLMKEAAEIAARDNRRPCHAQAA